MAGPKNRFFARLGPALSLEKLTSGTHCKGGELVYKMIYVFIIKICTELTVCTNVHLL